MIDPKNIRNDFPLFEHEPSIVYLDSAASALKLRAVIEKEREYLEKYPVNISRGFYSLSIRATEEYEKTRDAVAGWIGANREEIVFTSGTTGSINLLSYVLEEKISQEDNIVVTAMEHHANFLPWQALAKRVGASFRVIPVSEDGIIQLETLASFIDAHTKIFAFPHISNVLGVVSPVREISDRVRALAPNGIIVLDAAQSAPHISINTPALGVDFLAFSAHKCFGPTGVGVLWGKYALLESLPPFLYGGDMVELANMKGSTFKKPPYRFEAGTPNISGVIAFRAAVEYMQTLGTKNIAEHEKHLAQYAAQKLRTTFPDIHILGSLEAEKQSSILSFALPDVHAHDIAETLAADHVCIRAGAHCAHPLHSSLGIPATARLSFSIYNTEEDIDRAVASIQKARTIFSREPKIPTSAV